MWRRHSSQHGRNIGRVLRWGFMVAALSALPARLIAQPAAGQAAAKAGPEQIEAKKLLKPRAAASAAMAASAPARLVPAQLGAAVKPPPLVLAPHVVAPATSSPGAFKLQPANTAQLHQLGSAVLLKHGIELFRPGQAASGLPAAVLNDRAKVVSALSDLRQLDAIHSGPMTLYRRVAPNQFDRETQDALESATKRGDAAALTAGAQLFDAAQRAAATRRCNEASLALDREELNIRSAGLADPTLVAGSAAFWDTMGRLNPSLLSRYQDAAKRYADTCLDSNLQTLTPKQRTALDQVLGELFIDGAPSCMGTRIRADLFLTARHCLFRFDESLGWQPRPVNALHLTLAGVPQTRFRVAPIDCNAAAPDPACVKLSGEPLAADHLLLRIAASAKKGGSAALPPMPELRFESPTAKQFLVVPGYSSWFTGRAWSANDKPFATSAAVSGCVVGELANACIVNACQSDAGYSGAPMFVRRNVDQLVMVGIFLGTATAYPSCMRSDRNFGARLPQFLAASRADELAKGRQ